MPDLNPYDAVLGAGQSNDVSDLDPYTKQLLGLAQQQGGAVAQTAGEVVHPNGSFLSIAKDKLGNAFHGVMDALATPSETIAAGMSMFSQHPHSLSEAYKEHISPSEVLFGTGEAKSPLGKAGMFGVKFLTDTLLDPLTYATMGEYKGLLGLSKLPSIPIGPHTAEEMGWKGLVDTGKGYELVRHHALSDEGLAVQQKLTTRAEQTITKDTLEQTGFAKGSARGAGMELTTRIPGMDIRFVSADNIRGRITKTVGSLIGKSIEDMAIADLPGGAEIMAANTLMKIVKDMGLVAKPVAEMAPEELDKWTHATNTAVKQAMDDQAARLVRHTLQARRADIDLAVGEQMKNILERNAVAGGKVVDKMGKPVLDQFGNQQVRSLAQAYLDKGGFKFAGQSVISGVRIRSAMNLIKPAEDTVNAFSPKAIKTLAALSDARNKFASLFSTNWKSTARVPDTLLQIARTEKFKQDAQMNEFINDTRKMAQRTKLGPQELDVAYTAALLDKAPANYIDSRVPAIYALLHSKQGNEVLKEIANGKYGQGLNPDEIKKMWDAAKFVQKRMDQNLVMTRDAGMAVYEQKNYLPLMLNEPKNVLSPFLTTRSSEAANAQKGQLNKWVNVKDPSKVLFGTKEAARDSEGNIHNLKQYVKVEVKNRLNAQLDKEVMKNTNQRKALSDEIEKTWGTISEKLSNAILKPSAKIISKMSGGDRLNLEAIQDVIREAIPKVDRERLMKDYVNKAYEEGRKIIGGAELDIEDIEKLKEDLASGDVDLDHVADSMMKGAKDLAVKAGKKTGKLAAGAKKDAYDRALEKLRQTILENGIAGKKRYLQDALANQEITGTAGDKLSILEEQLSEHPAASLAKRFNLTLARTGGGLQDVMERALSKKLKPGQAPSESTKLDSMIENLGFKDFDEADKSIGEYNKLKSQLATARADAAKEAQTKGDKTFKEIINGLSDEWHKNPDKINRALESILGKKLDMQALMHDLEDTQRGIDMELKQPGLVQVADRWFYKDSADETYKRERATAQEINDNLFDGKEMFTTSTFKSMLGATENTLRTVNTSNLLRDIASKFGVPADQAPSNYLKVSIAKMSEKEGDMADLMSKAPGYKDNQELVYHPAVAQTIVDMMKIMDKDPASNQLLASYDHLTNVFKTSVTSIWPAFFGRNAISNVWQSMMDIGHEALSPANHMMAIQLQTFSKQLENLALDMTETPNAENLRKYFDVADKVILKDDRGYEWTVGELDRVIRDNVVAFNPSVLGMMDAGLTQSDRMKELEDELFGATDKWGNIKRQINPMKQNFVAFRVGRGLANYTESEPRILNFLANLRHSGDVSFAAHQTKQFLYDHSNLTPFERNFLRRVIPFYSYTRKNLEGVVTTLLHKTGRVDMFRNTYTNVGDVMAGGNLSNEERAMLPQWMRDSLDMVVAKNGKNVSLVTSMGSPFEAPFDELGNLFGSLNPIFKGPIEAATGYSFFEGKPLSQVTDAIAFKNAPQALKDLIGFTEKQYTDSAGDVHTQYVSLNPTMMNMFQNLPFTSRTLSSLALLENPNIETQNKILANLTGMKPTTIDMESEQFQRQKELDAQIQDILSKSGVGYQRTEYTAPTGTHLVPPPTNPENQ